MMQPASLNFDARSVASAVHDRTFAVVVSYCPDINRLRDLCGMLIAEGVTVVVVDNTEAPFLDATALPTGCRIVSLGYNSGIAHAQNIGIQAAMREGAKVIVLFDQDSIISVNFLQPLVRHLREGYPDAASPSCVDESTGEELPAVRLTKCGVPVPAYGVDSDRPYRVDVVISSGLAATREAYELVGLLDERLFIDYVDTEWCLRLRAKDVPIWLVPRAKMQHRIGLASVRFGRFTVLVHSPERCYYQIRNCLHLFRRPHVPLLFALKEIFSVAFSRALLLFMVTERYKYIKAYFAGLRDGVRGVGGRR